MKILKFGGTSLSTANRMRKLLPILLQEKASRKTIVLSAIAGVTNDLLLLINHLKKNEKSESREIINRLYLQHIDYAKELLFQSDSTEEKIKTKFQELSHYIDKKFENKFIGEILAYGELLSTTLFYEFLIENSINVRLLYAPNFIFTDTDHQPMMKKIENKLQPLITLSDVDVFVIQGFICTNSFNEVDNLQRGGSDYTASILGAAMNAKEIQIWTDIDGFHNNDPRFVSNTQAIDRLCFDEAAELAYFGAKILHPQSIHPAKKYNIPVRLLNTLAPDLEGTHIIAKKEKKNKIVAIAGKDGITAIRIESTRMLMAYGFLRKIFEVFENYKTPIDMITTSEVAVSLTIDSTEYLDSIIKELNFYGKVAIDKNQSIICVVGDFSNPMQGQATIVSEALKHLPVRMISYGGSQHNISMLLPEEYKIEALRSLHSRFF